MDKSDKEDIVQNFRDSEVFDRLFSMISEHIESSGNSKYEESEIIDKNQEFDEVNIENSSGNIEIKLVNRKESGYRTIAKCIFSEDTISEAYIDIGQQVGPLAGKGYRASYRNGEYNGGEWIS